MSVVPPRPSHSVVYRFRLASAEDAAAVHGSLEVDRGDRIPNVEAQVVREGGDRIVVTLRSSDLGDLRAATKSFFTRVRAAAAVLGEAAARDPKN